MTFHLWGTSLIWAFKGWTNHWPSFNRVFGWNTTAHKWNAHPNQVFYFQLENKSRSIIIAIFEVFLNSGSRIRPSYMKACSSLPTSAIIKEHTSEAKPKAHRPQWGANKVEDAICMNSAHNERSAVSAGQRKAPLSRAKGWKITV